MRRWLSLAVAFVAVRLAEGRDVGPGRRAALRTVRAGLLRGGVGVAGAGSGSDGGVVAGAAAQAAREGASLDLNATFFANVSVNASALEAWRGEIARVALATAQPRWLNGQADPDFEQQQCEIIRQYTAAPDQCKQRNDWIPREKLLRHLEGFKQYRFDLARNLPGPPCCMGLNHQFAIFVALKELQPLAIIESGVAAGRGTWLLRYAAPKAHIFSLDPGDPVETYGTAGLGGRGWKDLSGGTTYLTRHQFTDLAMTRWDILIPDPAVRARTLVILDDHQSSIERLRMLRNWGFRYVFYEDNYPFNVATSADSNTCRKVPGLARTWKKFLYGDAYSPNTICTSVPKGRGSVLEKDRFGLKCKMLKLEQHKSNVKWFQEHLKGYFEFPALFSRCSGIKRPPLLRPDLKVLQDHGLPPPGQEIWAYGHLFPALIELTPLSNVPTNLRTVNGQTLVTSEATDGYQRNLEGIMAIYKEIQQGKWP